MAILSISEFGRIADRAPIGTPTTTATANADRAICKVAGMRLMTMSSASLRYRIESPKSPVTALPMKTPYWTISGSFSPY